MYVGRTLTAFFRGTFVKPRALTTHHWATEHNAMPNG